MVLEAFYCTYAELFENVYEDFVRVILRPLHWLAGRGRLWVDVSHGPCDGGAGCSRLGEKAEYALLLGLDVLTANLMLNDHSVADSVLANILCSH